MIYAISTDPQVAVKFGFTGGDVNKRLASLQTGSPRQLHVIATCDGTIKQEKHLHFLLSQIVTKNAVGEWYPNGKATQEVVASIAGGWLSAWIADAERRVASARATLPKAERAQVGIKHLKDGRLEKIYEGLRAAGLVHDYTMALLEGGWARMVGVHKVSSTNEPQKRIEAAMEHISRGGFMGTSRELERAARDIGLSRSEAKALCSQYGGSLADLTRELPA